VQLPLGVALTTRRGDDFVLGYLDLAQRLGELGCPFTGEAAGQFTTYCCRPFAAAQPSVDCLLAAAHRFFGGGALGELSLGFSEAGQQRLAGDLVGECQQRSSACLPLGNGAGDERKIGGCIAPPPLGFEGAFGGVEKIRYTLRRQVGR
jgi:hypothetical protein